MSLLQASVCECVVRPGTASSDDHDHKNDDENDHYNDNDDDDGDLVEAGLLSLLIVRW